MSEKNKTTYKSLNKIARHPDVNEIWDEGDDGIWLDLKYPYVSPCYQVGTIHEWSCKDIKESFKQYLKRPWKYTNNGRSCTEDKSRTPVQKWD